MPARVRSAVVAFVKEEMPKGKRREFGVRRGKGKGEDGPVHWPSMA